MCSQHGQSWMVGVPGVRGCGWWVSLGMPASPYACCWTLDQTVPFLPPRSSAETSHGPDVRWEDTGMQRFPPPASPSRRSVESASSSLFHAHLRNTSLSHARACQGTDESARAHWWTRLRNLRRSCPRSRLFFLPASTGYTAPPSCFDPVTLLHERFTPNQAIAHTFPWKSLATFCASLCLFAAV